MIDRKRLRMVNIILIDKTGEIKECKFKNFVKDDLFKKCGLKKNDNFNMHTKWINNKSKFNFYKLEVWGKDVGRANTENKYDFPPPIDNTLFFGTCAIIAYNKEDEPIDLSQEEWESYYEFLFGGFENLDALAAEDEKEEDELENIPDEYKTKDGYLKDGFVVDSDDDSELSYDNYYYSDED